MLVIICVKFCEDGLNSFQVTEARVDKKNPTFFFGGGGGGGGGGGMDTSQVPTGGDITTAAFWTLTR